MHPVNEKRYPNVKGREAWVQLIRAYNHVEAIMSTDLRADDLTLARAHVLAALDIYGPMSQQALADHLHVTKGNIVGLVNKLAARGLVERKPSKVDRRSNLLRITPAGADVLDRIMPRQHGLIGDAMSVFTEAEALLLEKMLTRLQGQRLQLVANDKA